MYCKSSFVVCELFFWIVRGSVVLREIGFVWGIRMLSMLGWLFFMVSWRSFLWFMKLFMFFFLFSIVDFGFAVGLLRLMLVVVSLIRKVFVIFGGCLLVIYEKRVLISLCGLVFFFCLRLLEEKVWERLFLGWICVVLRVLCWRRFLVIWLLLVLWKEGGCCGWESCGGIGGCLMFYLLDSWRMCCWWLFGVRGVIVRWSLVYVVSIGWLGEI